MQQFFVFCEKLKNVANWVIRNNKTIVKMDKPCKYPISAKSIDRFVEYAFDNDLMLNDEFRALFLVIFDYFLNMLRIVMTHSGIYHVSITHVVHEVITNKKLMLNTDGILGKMQIYTYIYGTNRDFKPSANCSSRFHYPIQVFFNEHIFDDFLTHENVRDYVLFVISRNTKVRNATHIFNLSRKFLKCMSYQKRFYPFIATEMKTFGYLVHPRNNMYFKSGVSSRENCHKCLCDYTPYREFCNKYFTSLKIELLQIHEHVFANYEHEKCAHQLFGNVFVVKNICKFV